MNFPNHVKETLLAKINEMSQYPWLFANNPKQDFTRNRKLDFSTLIKILLSIEGGSLRKELLKFFHYNVDTATVSAFTQQRAKLLPEALDFLFHEFNNAFPKFNTYRGYRLLACDGTAVNIARNPLNTENYFQSSYKDKGFNQLHLNALYDLCSRRYVDTIIQPGRKQDEYHAMTKMIDRYLNTDKTIFIADRGYEPYNIFAHVEQKNQYYLIRAKDKRSRGMLSSFPLPETEEFDTEVSLILTKKQTNAIKECTGAYKFISTKSRFDYLDLHKNKFYPIKLRVLRFAISENHYGCIITNLSKEEIPIDEIKKIYSMRWGIETSFCDKRKK